MPEITFGNILTLMGFVIAGVTGGVSIYITLGKKIDSLKSDIKGMCIQYNALKERVDGIGKAREAAITAIRTEMHDRFSGSEEIRANQRVDVKVSIEKSNTLIGELFNKFDSINEVLITLKAEWKAFDKSRSGKKR